MDDEIKALLRVALVHVLVLALNALVDVFKRWIAAHRGDSGAG